MLNLGDVALPIFYLLVEPPEPSNLKRVSIYTLLQETELALLRCFMALLHLPTDASRILPRGRPFTEAVLRHRVLPSFRKSSANGLDPVLEDAARSAPVMCVLLAQRIPDWLQRVAESRPMVVMSQFDDSIAAAGSLQGMHPALLRGHDDLRGFYRALRSACSDEAQLSRLSEGHREALDQLSKLDLLADRSTLDFIPECPLPSPVQGRAAAYLLNRLSNQVVEPALSSSRDIDSGAIPGIYSAAARGVLALAGQEDSDAATLGGSSAEAAKAAYTAMARTSDVASKLRLLLEFGRELLALNGDGIFIAAPAVRNDIVRGRVPSSAVLDPGHSAKMPAALRAMRDFVAGGSQNHFEPQSQTRDYKIARETLLLEQRFVSCVSASLAGRVALTPYQLPFTDGSVFETARQLNVAIERQTRKVTSTFRKLERQLGELLPADLKARLTGRHSGVQVLSDLPFEWALIDRWPLCLTGPVARIPLGMMRWDVLCAALESRATISKTDPSRVLVLDLIESHDNVREYSKSFRDVSDSLSQKYRYETPQSAGEFREKLAQPGIDIVVLDTHGQYDSANDQVWLTTPSGPALMDQLLPDQVIPPVWILSACDTSVTGALRGCLVRRLLAQGAVCVIATLAPVDAFTAEIFVGRLLTDIYSPVNPDGYNTLDEVIFATQLTTAMLYDPMLPLMRRAHGDQKMQRAVGGVFSRYFSWVTRYPSVDPARFGHEAAFVLGKAIDEEGLRTVFSGLDSAGLVRPETLLFSTFGAPRNIDLVS